MPKAERVGHGIRQLRILPSETGEDGRVPQRLQPYRLHLGVVQVPTTGLLTPLGSTAVTGTGCVLVGVFHQHPQHGIFLDLALLEGFGVVEQLDVVVEEGLERRFDVGVALNDGFEVADGDFLPDVDGDQILLNRPFGRRNGNGDEPVSTGQSANQVP